MGVSTSNARDRGLPHSSVSLAHQPNASKTPSGTRHGRGGVRSTETTRSLALKKRRAFERSGGAHAHERGGFEQLLFVLFHHVFDHEVARTAVAARPALRGDLFPRAGPRLDGGADLSIGDGF